MKYILLLGALASVGAVTTGYFGHRKHIAEMAALGIQEQTDTDQRPTDIATIPQEFCGDWYRCRGDSFSADAGYSLAYHVTSRGFSEIVQMNSGEEVVMGEHGPRVQNVPIIRENRILTKEKFRVAKENGELVLIRLTPNGIDRGEFTPKYIYTPPDKITERTTVHTWPNGRAEAYYLIR